MNNATPNNASQRKFKNVFIRTTCFSDTQDIADELKTAVRHLSIYNVLIKYQRKELLIF